MYFSLPISSEQPRTAALAAMKLNDEWVQEIIANVQEHWGSPAIMTPDTLAYILTNQWTREPAAGCQGNPTPPTLVSQSSADPELAVIKPVASLTIVQRLVSELSRTMHHCGQTDLAHSLMTDKTLNEPGRSPDIVLQCLTDILQTHNHRHGSQPDTVITQSSPHTESESASATEPGHESHPDSTAIPVPISAVANKD